MAAGNSDPEASFLQSEEGSPSPAALAAGRLPFKACVAVGLVGLVGAVVLGAVMLGRTTAGAPTKVRDPDPCSAIDPWSAIDLHKLQECKSFLKALEKKAEEQGWSHEFDPISVESLACNKSEQACTVQYEMYGMSIGQAKCFPAVCKDAVEANMAVCKEAVVEETIFKEVEANLAGMPAEASLSGFDVFCTTPDTAKEADADTDGEDVPCDVSCTHANTAAMSSPVAITLTRPPDTAQSEHPPHDTCNSVSKLPTTLDLVEGDGLERVNMCRCALVGSSSNLLGKRAGDLIDSYDTVIRVNRVPRGAIQKDLGKKTDVLVLNTHNDPMEPKVAVMTLGGNGSEPPRVNCSSLDSCRSSSLVWRADEKSGEDKYGPCHPQELADAWGRDHPFVACVRPNASGISWGFKEVRPYVPSSGFVAFVTFLTLCKELDLFGFGGTATADGHIEAINKHNLEEEHNIQDAFVARKHKPSWINSKPRHVDPDALDWIWHHGAKVRKMDASV